MLERAPIDIAGLRRSTRSTRYDGFKMNLVTDAKKAQSKVKPRKAPSITCSSKATDPHASLLPQNPEAQSDGMPPPTPVQQIQYVGTVLCGVPANELSPQKLLESEQGATSDSH